MVVLFVIVVIICFYALEFQRRVLELLVQIRETLEDLKLDKERETSGSNPLPEQVTTIEELNSLDETLSDASVRQQLVGFATVSISTLTTEGHICYTNVAKIADL